MPEGQPFLRDIFESNGVIDLSFDGSVPQPLHQGFMALTYKEGSHAISFLTRTQKGLDVITQPLVGINYVEAGIVTPDNLRVRTHLIPSDGVGDWLARLRERADLLHNPGSSILLYEQSEAIALKDVHTLTEINGGLEVLSKGSHRPWVMDMRQTSLWTPANDTEPVLI